MSMDRQLTNAQLCGVDMMVVIYGPCVMTYLASAKSG